MAFCTVLSAAIEGLHVLPVFVETDISNGLPMFHMVGYLSTEVKEAAERVRTAVRNSGIQIPAKKIVINLAPGTVRKRGASFDLPMALSMLGAMELLKKESLKGVMILGELSLDGAVKGVNGILPIVQKAKQLGVKRCILPKENQLEGALVSGVEVFGVADLQEAYRVLRGEEESRPVCVKSWEKNSNPLAGSELDFSDIHGQESVKRAVEVAVAGGHNLLMIGPPGSGKSMIAKRIPGILPTPSPEESVEITGIYSVLGMIDKDRPFITGRPFRSVHHTTTKAALIGGGLVPKPGELSLAHGGVLFLDELAEFSKPVLEVLRQPLEEREIRITRSRGNYVFPANMILAAATNPCPCGYYPDYSRCNCTPWQIQQYLGKISQPLLDRIDICVEVPKLSYEQLHDEAIGECSAVIRERVERGREIQKQRFCGEKFQTNALIKLADIETYCTLDTEGERIMRQAFSALRLTARTYHKILRVARTIADLDGEEQIRTEHLKEAIGYRTMDKKYWGNVL